MTAAVAQRACATFGSATPALHVPDCHIGYYTSASTGEVAPASCGRWTCAKCGPVAKRKFLLRTMSVSYNWMLTLTYEDRTYLRRARELERPEEYVNRCWHSFARWLRRNYGLSTHTWVNEHGETRGRVHKHLVVKLSRALNYKRARRALHRCGLGRQCRFERITDPDGAACYLGKYLAKGLGQEWPRYSRRVQNAAPRWFEPMWTDIRKGDVEPNIWTFQKLVEPGRPSWRDDVRLEDLRIRANAALELELSAPRSPPAQLAVAFLKP
jgi:hypothetical protein